MFFARKLTVTCLIVAVLASLSIPLIQAQEDVPDLSGYWFVEGYGIAFVIEEGRFIALEMGSGNCTEIINGLIDGNIVHDVPLLNADIALTVENDELVIWFEADEMARAVRLADLPEECRTRTDLAQLLPPPEEVVYTSLAELDTQIATLVEGIDVPGLAIALIDTNGVAWSQGYGYADLDAELPVTPDTPFLVSSNSKPVTAAAVMHAWESGLFALDDDINDHLPFVVDNPQLDGETITLRDLLTHTSSILDSEFYVQGYQPGDPVLANLVAFLAGYLIPGGEWYDPDANFAPDVPGTSWQYGNVGIALAALLVQTERGIPFADYCESAIFAPLNMTNTHWFLADYADPGVIALPYDNDHQPMAHFGHPTWPAGQLRSSVDDLGRFLAAIMNGGTLDGMRILDAATVEVMLTPQLGDLGDIGVRQALGWTYDASGTLVGHNGGDPGATVVMYFDPVAEIGVVILINEGTVKAIDLADLLVAITLGRADDLAPLLRTSE